MLSCPWNSEWRLRRGWNFIASKIWQSLFSGRRILFRQNYSLYCRTGLQTWSYEMRWLQSHLETNFMVFYGTENCSNVQQRNTPVLLTADVAMLTGGFSVCFLNILIIFCQYFTLKVKILLKWIPQFSLLVTLKSDSSDGLCYMIIIALFWPNMKIPFRKSE